MIFREKGTSQNPLQEAVGDLPAIEPRQGLKEEMLARILAEARQEEQAAAVAKKRRLSSSAIRTSLSIGGVVAAACLTVALLPSLQEAPPSSVTSGSDAPQSSLAVKEKEEEIALKQAQREQRLLRQVIPHNNGQFIGEGVEITIHDQNSALVRKGVLANDLESNFDIYRLVQELYTNGGQLVSINGIQVGAYTKVITHGTLMEIQDRRVQAPFTIKVIGDGQQLYQTLQDPQSVLMQLKVKDNLDVTLSQEELVAIGEE